MRNKIEKGVDLNLRQFIKSLGIYRRRNCTAGKHTLAVFLHTRKT